MRKGVIRRAVLGALAVLVISGCSGMTGVIKDAVLPSADKGIEATVQMGKENNKGLVNAKLDASKSVDVGEVTGNANIGSGNTVTNDAKTMIGLVLAGMLLPMLLLFWIMPTPQWLQRRYNAPLRPT